MRKLRWVGNVILCMFYVGMYFKIAYNGRATDFVIVTYDNMMKLYLIQYKYQGRS